VATIHVPRIIPLHASGGTCVQTERLRTPLSFARTCLSGRLMVPLLLRCSPLTPNSESRLRLTAKTPFPKAYGSGHHRIMTTSNTPRSRMTWANASQCRFCLDPSARIHLRKNVWAVSHSHSYTRHSSFCSVTVTSEVTKPLELSTHSDRNPSEPSADLGRDRSKEQPGPEAPRVAYQHHAEGKAKERRVGCGHCVC
jgi:hypothetical protein